MTEYPKNNIVYGIQALLKPFEERRKKGDAPVKIANKRKRITGK